MLKINNQNKIQVMNKLANIEAKVDEEIAAAQKPEPKEGEEGEEDEEEELD